MIPYCPIAELRSHQFKEYNMKEFDKWWLMAAQNLVGVGRATERDIAEEVWQAALEWIKYAGVLEPSLANDLIDKELEE